MNSLLLRYFILRKHQKQTYSCDACDAMLTWCHELAPLSVYWLILFVIATERQSTPAIRAFIAFCGFENYVVICYNLKTQIKCKGPNL